VTIRAIIVDDEELARRGIRALTTEAGDIEIVAECSNGIDAIEAIRSSALDLVFLDVQMPGKNGFEVIEAIGVEECPHIIFVTAFDRYALNAFDAHALDYLLKPIDEKRFDRALARARAALSSERDSDLGRRLAQLIAEVGSPEPIAIADRIPVKTGGRVVVVRVADIDWVEANGDYVTLHAGGKKWLLRETISMAEARLAPARFVRIHRSTLVNTDRVREMRPLNKGEFAVILADGTEVKLSRKYRDAIRRVAGTDL
jgi:two-component system LytT family response regulator